jgi:hypothetical protein
MQSFKSMAASLRGDIFSMRAGTIQMGLGPGESRCEDIAVGALGGQSRYRSLVGDHSMPDGVSR